MSEKKTNKQDVAILGAGIVGICSAIRLQQQGLQVTLYDGKGIAQGCSKGNAGHFATEQVFPLAQANILPQLPKMLLDPKGALRISPRYLLKAIPWFCRFLLNMPSKMFNSNKRALKALNENAIDAWQSLIDESNNQDLFTLQGSLLTFESNSTDEALKVQAHYANEGVSVKLLTREKLDKLQPDLHSAITHALYFDEVGHTASPYQLTLTLYQYALTLGVNFVQQNINAINSTEQGVTLTSNEGCFNADKVLIAAGAHSKPFCKQLGFNVPLDTERGYHYMVKTEKQPKMPVVSYEKKFILTPMQEGLRFAGTVEFAGLEQEPNYQRANMLKQLGESIWPHIDDSIDDAEKRWMGFRPTLPDSLPVMGRSPKHENVFFNFGHQHLGLTLAAFCADLIADEMSQQQTQVSLKPYSIARFN